MPGHACNYYNSHTISEWHAEGFHTNQTQARWQECVSDPTLSSENKPFLWFSNQHFCKSCISLQPTAAPRGNDTNAGLPTKSLARGTAAQESSLIQNEPVLANPSRWHHSSVLSKAAHSLQWWKREGWGWKGQAGMGGRRSLYCYMHRETKETKDASLYDVLLCTCFKAWNAHNS